jgi:hypothetical protein
MILLNKNHFIFAEHVLISYFILFLLKIFL